VRELARAEGDIGETFRPNPAVGALRRAIAELRIAGIEDASLVRRLQEAERVDADRRETRAAPVRTMRSATAALENWSEVWAAADTRLKNQLLRQAGVTAVIGRDPGQEGGPAHLQAITATNSIFALALAVALRESQRTFDGHQPYEPSDLRTVVRLDEQAAPIAERLGMLDAGGQGVSMVRPTMQATRRKRSKHRAPSGRSGRVTAWRKRLDLPAGRIACTPSVRRPTSPARPAGSSTVWPTRVGSRSCVSARTAAPYWFLSRNWPGSRRRTMVAFASLGVWICGRRDHERGRRNGRRHRHATLCGARVRVCRLPREAP